MTLTQRANLEEITASENIEGLILNHKRRLQKLNEYIALHGADVGSSMEIGDIEAAIEELEAELESLENEPLAGISAQPFPPQTTSKVPAGTFPGEVIIKPKVVITLRYDFARLSNDARAAAINTLAGVMGIAPDEIEVMAVRQGSIVFELRVPLEAIIRLRSRLETNSAQLRLLKVEEVALEDERGQMEEWVTEDRQFKRVTPAPIPPEDNRVFSLRNDRPAPPQLPPSPPISAEKANRPWDFKTIILTISLVIILLLLLAIMCRSNLGQLIPLADTGQIGQTLANFLNFGRSDEEKPTSTFVSHQNRLQVRVGEEVMIKTYHTSKNKLGELEILVNRQPLGASEAAPQPNTFPDTLGTTELVTIKVLEPTADYVDGVCIGALCNQLATMRVLTTSQPLLADSVQSQYPNTTWTVFFLWTGHTPGSYDLSLQVTDNAQQKGPRITQRIEVK
ncbi:MAG: hypothetical protein JXM69_04820 [Anaerolineae bacterium]|nr:hypothetical protein [Anaerolineae bacterium]